MTNIVQIPEETRQGLHRVIAELEAFPSIRLPMAGGDPVDMLAKMRCAVLVETPLAAAIGGDGKPLQILWFNGDESKGQIEAERWCREHPGHRAWVMTASAASPAIAGVHVKWNKE